MQDTKPHIRLKYNGVIVIQSLMDGDRETGKELYDDIIDRRCQLKGKAAYLHIVSSKDEFLVVLNEICTLVKGDELLPIIHLEIHGNENGLVFTNGEGITWKEIQAPFRFINIIMRNQLIVSLATCYGSQIWKMIDITKPAPYWGYIGPKEKIREGVLLEDFSGFYDSLLSDENWDNALNIIKENGTRQEYIYLHCKGIFEYHIERRFKYQPIDKKSTFKRLAKKTKEYLPALNRSSRRKKLKENIETFNRTAFLLKIKKTFLME